jgi:DNA-binding transcriptional ArsR family regulator
LHTNPGFQREYNIFNMSNISSVDQIATLLQAAGHPVRLQILLALGEGEACVCHLEATLGRRQAYLSQHLMALREAGLVTDRRESRFIFYQLADPRLLNVLRQVAEIQKVDLPALAPSPSCDCPQCSTQRGDGCKGCQTSTADKEPA